MDFLATALVAAISHIERQEVPDDVADRDVQMLEFIFYHLRQCDESEKERIGKAARSLAENARDARVWESMDFIVENLQE